MLEPAPLLTDIARAPEGGAAHWLRADDGVRIRAGHWRPDAAKGTVILCPGRTEFVEKYGLFAGALYERGYASLVIDWRGQGMADRLLDDRRIGHVDRFTDFQRDLKAALALAEQLDLPRPWHILGHSMGGAIVLRAVMDGLDVQSAIFTGPMFGIRISPVLRPVGWALAYAAPCVGLGQMLPPTTKIDNYVQANGFEGNILTSDPEMYKLMQDQVLAYPDLALGGPSLVWLREALTEALTLSRRPSPNLPALAILGAEEKIIETQRVHDRMAAWPDGELDVIEGAEHEVLMETPEVRARILDKMMALFDRAAAPREMAQTA
ncbi:MAG: alpha/beta fold hydrolase [Paracoccaceae bacterium]